MPAFAVLSAAAPGRPFVLPLRSSRPLLAQGGALAKLAALTPASHLEVRPAPGMVSSGIRELDALTGGLPRGCITEICGLASSGRTSVLLAALAGATQRGEVGALVDASDALDPASAAAAGIEMKRLLWVRCGKAVASCQLPVTSHSAVRLNCSSPESWESRCPAHTLRTENRELRTIREPRLWERKLEQVLKVTDLLLQSNGFGMIALDLGDVPAGGARRIPLASWFRFRRAVEHTPTVLLVIEQQPIAGSCSSVVVKVAGKKKLSAISSQLSANRLAHAELLDQCEITAELMRLRLDHKPVQSATSAFRSRAAWAG
jgi:RecA DNA recombination protein